MWIGTQWMVEGEVGRGTGWLARAARLLEGQPGNSAPVAYLTLSRSYHTQAKVDLDRAIMLAGDAATAGRRLADRDLIALALHRPGLLLLAVGRENEGWACSMKQWFF
jgi:hypothetical protein